MKIKFTVSSRDGFQHLIETSSTVRVSRLIEELLKSLRFSDNAVDVAPSSFRLSSITSNEILGLSGTLEQNGVKHGDTLLLWKVYPRQTQLRLERESLQKLAQENDSFNFKAHSSSSIGEADSFTFQFHGRSIIGITDAREPIYGEEHTVSVLLDDLTPEERPRLRWDTAIWHPNIQHSEPKGVMIRPWWTPGQGLDELAKLLLNMLQYKIYHAEYTPPFPLDLEVARWVTDYAEPNRIIDKARGLLSATNIIVAPADSSHRLMAALKSNKIILFISHSSEDAALVALLVDLLTSALSLNASEIRCTSVDGYRLPIGVKTDEYLRQEIQDAQLFIGLISTSSLRSTYVLFELGARWGCGKHLAPLLAPASIPRILSSPLANLNALRCDNASQLHQLIHDLADELGISPGAPADNQRYIERIINHVKAEVSL